MDLGGRVSHKQVERVVDGLDIVLPHRPAVAAQVLKEGVGHKGACRKHGKLL